MSHVDSPSSRQRMAHLLLIPALLLLACQASGQTPAPKPDSIGKRLVEAKEAFVKEMASADAELLDAIKEALSDATSEGDFDRAKRLTATKDAFEKEFLLPTDGSLGSARSGYQRRFVDARQAVEGVFDELVVECTMQGDLERCDSLRAEKQRWLDKIAERKTNKTRYRSPIPSDAAAFNGHRYALFPELVTWQVAQQKCEDMDGHLVVFEDQQEVAFARDTLKATGRVWIGIAKANPQGELRTVYGSVPTYLPWARRQPDGAIFVFCEMPTGEFGDVSDRRYAFICEWDK